MSNLMEFSVVQSTGLKGASEGELKVFRDKGIAKAFMWKTEEQKWEEIGEVVDPGQTEDTMAKPTVGPTKYYKGDVHFDAGEYDHVFDVELGDGILRPLPFNNGGNYLEASDKFCARERLNRGNIEQITKFLKTNALAFKTRDFDGQDALKAKQALIAKQRPKCIPQMTHLFFEGGNVAGAQKKILEFNAELNQISDPLQFEGLVALLGSPQNFF